LLLDFYPDPAGNVPCRGCALGRDSGRDEAAEPSMPRSRQVEERSVRWYKSTGDPGWRRRQVKAIQPRQASMVRMRTSSNLVKGSRLFISVMSVAPPGRHARGERLASDLPQGFSPRTWE